MARQEGFVKRPLYRKGILCNQDDDEDTRSQEEELHWGKCNEVNLQFSSVQSLSSIQLILTPMDCSTPGFPVHHQLQELTQTHVHIMSVMPSNHLILFCPLFLLLSIFPSIRVFSNESVLHIRWPEYWSFTFSISPSGAYSGLISFRID